MRHSREKKEVLLYLEKMPPFRERRLKSRGIGNLIKANHPSLKDVPREVMTEVVEEILAMDRYWRLILADRVDLQGRDYNGKGYKEKEQLEQEVMERLNYQAGSNQKLNV